MKHKKMVSEISLEFYTQVLRAQVTPVVSVYHVLKLCTKAKLGKYFVVKTSKFRSLCLIIFMKTYKPYLMSDYLSLGYYEVSGSHSGRVVTLSPITSEGGAQFPWDSSGKAGSCLPLVGSLQYRTLTN